MADEVQELDQEQKEDQTKEKNKKPIFYRATKRDYQRHDITRKTR